MYSYKIRIGGIYDKRTLKSLIEQGITKFAFDFRPRSFNFLQQYIFIELMKEFFSSKHSYYLCYGVESSVMIQKNIDDLIKVFGEKLVRENFFLEFYSDEERDFYSQFGLKFLQSLPLHVSFNNGVQTNDLWKGIILDYDLIRSLHENNNLLSLASNISTYSKKEQTFEIIFQVPWHEGIISSVFDYLPIKTLTLDISSQVEICYRNVSLPTVAQEIKYLHRQLDDLSKKNTINKGGYGKH